MRPQCYFSLLDDRALKNSLICGMARGLMMVDRDIPPSAIAPKPMMPIRSTVAAKIINPLQNPKHCRERTSERSLIFCFDVFSWTKGCIGKSNRT